MIYLDSNKSFSIIPDADPARNSPDGGVHDLFNYGGTFVPPSAKGSETSRNAANEIADYCKGIRGKVARRLLDIFPCGETPDEVAAVLEISILTARPRFSELSFRGLIEKTNERRATSSLIPGAKAPRKFLSEVWRASPLLRGEDIAPSIIPAPGIDGGAK
jgi:hypothetical protein